MQMKNLLEIIDEAEEKITAFFLFKLKCITTQMMIIMVMKKIKKVKSIKNVVEKIE